jgi:hypothetical protein
MALTLGAPPFFELLKFDSAIGLKMTTSPESMVTNDLLPAQ